MGRRAGRGGINSGRAGRGFSTLLVQGDSMLPTYSAGDWLLARWGNYELANGTNNRHGRWFKAASYGSWRFRVKVGDSVVIERPEQPGIYYVKRIAEIEIADNRIFLLSDNPHGSDSRQWGWLPAASIIAKIVTRVRRARRD